MRSRLSDLLKELLDEERITSPESIAILAAVPYFRDKAKADLDRDFKNKTSIIDDVSPESRMLMAQALNGCDSLIGEGDWFDDQEG